MSNRDISDISIDYEDALQLVNKKNKDYGNAKYKTGNVLAEMFTDGIHLDSSDDFNEFCIFLEIIKKSLRYANLRNKKESDINYEGVEDTLMDLGNYAFILKNMIRVRKLNTKGE